MPRFFFDTDDGDVLHHDDTGQDVADVYAARKLAISSLPDMARDKIPDGDRRNFAVRVRDESGTVVYSAFLDFSGEWRTTPP